MVPLLELYTNRLHSLGWNSEAVITSVSSSMLAGLMATMLKDWALANILLGLASTMSSMGRSTGTRRDRIELGSLMMPLSSFRLYPSALLSLSDTFQSLMVLSLVERRKWAGFFLFNHLILFIFSSISKLFR